MIPLVFAGAGVGLGLWLVTRGLRSRPSLADVGFRLDAPGRTAVAPEVGTRARLEDRLTAMLTSALQAAGMDPGRRAADLRVARRTVDQHVLAKLAWAVGLGGTGLLLGLLLAPSAGPLGVLMLWPAGTVAGFCLPELLLTSRARDARVAFRHAYGGYLDLVNVMLAAGAGPESALHTAADSGGGWVFAEIRGALAAARRTRQSVAEAFASLGEELDITELKELAASVALVGSQGARVRSSLGTKADSLRDQQIAETEAEAEAATERMTLPVALLLLAFLLLLAYPAVQMIGQTTGG